MAEKPPPKDFGKRRPRLPAALPLPPREPVKRSGHVALLVMGTIAVGSTAFMLTPRRNCDPMPPGATVPGATVPGATAPAQANTNCSSSSSGGSGGGHWSSRSSFFSSDSSSHSSPGGSSDSGSGGVTRGGFGSFGHGFSGGE
ncbi:hypothetical protein JQ621_23565 [Bradyrhizobium manausense]|uniref:hypothetical protein n=1 Tax=Bradyrhizobium manausense TaxID=989370 RepID=UPI001BAE3CBD|nr:hypothetical protein [Bradyrhizobium manausense]MBR1090456.1 hypothetical protein [Bradyrhizobium manausense]